MAVTNTSGPFANYGKDSNGGVVNFRTPVITDTAVRFARVLASTDKPVYLETSVCVITADSGITVSVGFTGATYTDLINAASLTTAATGGTFLPASNAVSKYLFTVDTDLYYIGSSGADTGVVDIIFRWAQFSTDTTTGL